MEVCGAVIVASSGNRKRSRVEPSRGDMKVDQKTLKARAILMLASLLFMFLLPLFGEIFSIKVGFLISMSAGITYVTVLIRTCCPRCGSWILGVIGGPETGIFVPPFSVPRQCRICGLSFEGPKEREKKLG